MISKFNFVFGIDHNNEAFDSYFSCPNILNSTFLHGFYKKNDFYIVVVTQFLDSTYFVYFDFIILGVGSRKFTGFKCNSKMCSYIYSHIFLNRILSGFYDKKILEFLKRDLRKDS